MTGLMSDEFMSAVLSPVSEDRPSGVYLKSSPNIYRPFRNALTIAQSSLQKLSFNPDPEGLDNLIKTNKENWEQLEDLLIDVLMNHSRDLEIMVWLAMAQLFSGQPYVRLTRALHLMEQAIVVFWPRLQPCLPEKKLKSTDDKVINKERIEWLARPLKILFGDSKSSCQIAVPLRMLPLVEGVSYVYYMQHDLRGGVEDQGLRSAIFNEKNELINRVFAIDSAIKALEALNDTLQKHFLPAGVSVPSSSFFRTQLEANLIGIKNLTTGIITPWPLDSRAQKKIRDKSPSFASSDSQICSPEPNNASLSTRKPEAIVSDELGDRDSVFRQLHQIAQFFLINEPQSPVSYILERAIRWGYTPLPDLMKELLEDDKHAMARISSMMCIGEVRDNNLLEAAKAKEDPQIMTSSPSVCSPDNVSGQKNTNTTSDDGCFFINNLDEI